MTYMLDTNIFLDILLTERLKSFPESNRAVEFIVGNENDVCVLSASAVTDIFYILRKAFKSSEKAKKCLRQITRFAYIADVKESDIQNALNSKLDDFEDSVVDEVSFRIKCDFILTRNSCDFVGSKVPAITPEKFARCR